MLNTPFPPWPSFTDDEVEAVARVVRSNRVNYWTGAEGREFEKEYAAWAGAKHAIALHNGTLALEAAVRALGIGPGDEVVVAPRTFIASASCVIPMGGVPVFADVDRDSGNISAETIAPALTKRTKAIIPVHLGGMPCDMDPIVELAKARGIKVIEDCAQAHGARYKGRNIGGFGEIGAWSFCQDKIITTGGEGGMVTTDDAALWNVMWSYKDHGKSHSAVYEREHPPGYRWVHESFGSNWRMLEVQSAIGRWQLRQLSCWTKQRRANAEHVLKAASECAGLRVPQTPSWAEHAAYRAYAYVEPRGLKSGWSRDRIIAAINEGGVPCYQGSCSEVYLEKAFDGTGFRPAKRLPVAKELGETSLSFLVHPTLERSHLDKTTDVLRQVMREAVR